MLWGRRRLCSHSGCASSGRRTTLAAQPLGVPSQALAALRSSMGCGKEPGWLLQPSLPRAMNISSSMQEYVYRLRKSRRHRPARCARRGSTGWCGRRTVGTLSAGKTRLVQALAVACGIDRARSSALPSYSPQHSGSRTLITLMYTASGDEEFQRLGPQDISPRGHHADRVG
jgi:hypothetical protein